ncbi:MAG: hypothetical protein AAF961_04405, partial [Planctomycetota bacterium]
MLAALGCSNQSSAPSNPFLQADRVPPPTTRPLEPGAARPYYPGDPPQLGAPPAGAAPQPHYAPSGAPGSFAPTGAPPASAYPGASGVGTPPVGSLGRTPDFESHATNNLTGSGSTGMNGVQLASAETPLTFSETDEGDAVSVPSDSHAMRFPAGPAPQTETTDAFRAIGGPTASSAASGPESSAVAAKSTPSTPGVRMPIQSILPTAPSATLSPAVPTSASPPPQGYQSVQERSVSAAEPPPGDPPSASIAANDGFRPQGSTAAGTGSGADSRFRAPNLAPSNVPGTPVDGRFGVGEGYQ